MKAVKVKTLYADPGNKAPQHEVIVTFDSRIVDVVPWSAESALPSSVEVMDFKDKVMLPGLIDAHCHLMHPGDIFKPEDVPDYSYGMAMQLGVRNAQRALRRGVTTLRDAGGRADVLFPMRQGIREGITTGPDLLLAGASITPTGGHGHRAGGAADGPDEVRKKIREHCLLGADYVKIMATGGGTPGTTPGVLTFSREELQAASDEAHRLTRKATAHVTSKQGIVECLEVGLDGIEHCQFITAYQPDYDPKLAERIVRQNVVVCPTLAVFKESIEYLDSIAQERPLSAYESERMSWFTHMQKIQVELCALMFKDGIQMIAGTDAGWRLNTFGNIYQELELMSEAGFSAVEALRSATSFSADALGLADKTGRIVSGLQADMFIVDGDPGKSLSNLRNVAQVFKEGEKITL